MGSSKKLNIAVEINIQDIFSSSSTTTADVVNNSVIDQNTWRDWFQAWLNHLSYHLPQSNAYELSLRLTDDLEIQKFNSQYRNQNKPTDVLAFATLEVNIPKPSTEDFNWEPLYVGDIIISVDTACRQAKQQGHSLSTELAWLATHGLLHLLGWDHPDEESLLEMLSQQEALLQVIGLVIKKK